ncbi:MAG TPA: hypothetical protein VN253_13030 [Kofleriaceae bacterium]|nr:hypothetical protein [Kofleriaceae bacterium]
MSLRTACIVLALISGLGGCGGGGGGKQGTQGEPTTAKEKQLRDAKAAGDTDAGQTKWGKWRYTGDRGNCFFVAGQKCFKTEVEACRTMKCKAGEKCKSSGAGPATVACSK